MVIEISCSQWEGSACTQRALLLFSLKLWGEDFFFFPLFPMGSHRVPNMCPRFPMCFPRVFPVSPRFNLLCFAQSPPLLTYIGGPKGRAPHLSIIESSILGSLRGFNFSLVMGQSNWLIAKIKKRKKLDL
jgi:hypothetical protein